MQTCPSSNVQEVDQSSFWSSDGLHWDAHRIGWAISGGCALLTVIISMFSVLSHCRNYTVPTEQRQIIRILYMPPVYAIVSFFSYRFFRSYTYYELIEVVYEAITLSAFMLLIIEYVASTASDHSARKALERKDKRKLPIPLCCWRYRPTKAYFLYTMKWLVMQYVVVRPLVSIAGIICEAFNILCEDEGLAHFEFAYVYLSIVDFISISLSLYGLFVFYGLTKDELKGQRPLAKFLCIKLIVMFTFYQSFVFELLEGRVIHETPYWTETNIVNGLTALTICIEMVFFAAAMMWSYPVAPYKEKRIGPHTGIGRPLWDSINFSDFAAEIWSSLKFFIHYMRGKPETRTPKNKKPNLVQAFGAEGTYAYAPSGYVQSNDIPESFENENKAGIGAGPGKNFKHRYNNNYNYTASGTDMGMGAGPVDDDVNALEQGRKYHIGAADAGSGHSGSLEQDGECVRLTTFPPRNGSTSMNPVSGEMRLSDDTASGTYVGSQSAYPTTEPQSQYRSGRRMY